MKSYSELREVQGKVDTWMVRLPGCTSCWIGEGPKLVVGCNKMGEATRKEIENRLVQEGVDLSQVEFTNTGEIVPQKASL